MIRGLTAVFDTCRTTCDATLGFGHKEVIVIEEERGTSRGMERLITAALLVETSKHMLP
jgi:hypothetical protein